VKGGGGGCGSVLESLMSFGWSGWLVGWGDGRGGFVALLRAGRGKGSWL